MKDNVYDTNSIYPVEIVSCLDCKWCKHIEDGLYCSKHSRMIYNEDAQTCYKHIGVRNASD